MKKTKRFFLFLFTVFLGFTVSLLVQSAFNTYDAAKSSGTSADVIQTKNGVTTYLKDKYSSYSKVTVSAGTEKKLNTYNFSQGTLNDYFNANYQLANDESVTGTCSLVEILSLLEYYDRVKGQTDLPSTTNEAFCDIVLVAISNEYYTVGEGTKGDDVDNLLNDMFYFYHSTNTAYLDHLNIYSHIKSEIDASRPVGFGINGHGMVGAGYVTYTTTYETTSGVLWWKKTVTTTKTDDFVIVNDGWTNSSDGGDGQYSCFPTSSIGTNIIDLWQFDSTRITEN